MKKSGSKKIKALCSFIAIVFFAAVVLSFTGCKTSSPTIDPSSAVTSVVQSDAVVSNVDQPTETAAPADTAKGSHHIENVVPALLQGEMKAGCETHAVCSLLKTLGYDIDDFDFADNYIEEHYVYTDDETGIMYGPDMNSGFAGSPYAGWGIYAPAMAKIMNNYLNDVKSKQKAYPLEGMSLEELCKEYIDKDIPVAVWATTNMDEPYPYDTWEVNYVDENAKYKIGDSFSWLMHEHCLTLVGYDETSYYFSDSVVGGISQFDRALAEERYEQLGKQAIVVK